MPAVNEEKINRDSNTWNAVFSMLNAVQTALLLFLIVHLCGDTSAGIFSFAFSVAYLMIMIGNYGVRNYHATDVMRRFASRDYYCHRGVCCFFMALFSIVYVLMHSYELEKCAVIILCCFLKLIESIEDVIHGEFQRNGRLDIACKCGTIRYIFSMVGFVGVLFIFKNMVVSFIIMDSISVILLIATTLHNKKGIFVNNENKGDGWIKLFYVCFPLFLSSFFNIYICNASKYAIDMYYTDDIQGYYGMLFMPVFVINLLCICIYRPKLVSLAEDWCKGKTVVVRRFYITQIGLISIISVFVMIIAYIFGMTVLSFFFGMDLYGYKKEFMILLAGGAMTAVADFCNNMITVIRKQNTLIWIYGTVSIITFLFTVNLVRVMGIMGAALSYTLSVFCLAMIMSICFWINSKKLMVVDCKNI